MATEPTSEREETDRWVAESSRDDLIAAARTLQGLPHRVLVWGALSALRALLRDAPSFDVDLDHIERAGLLADAIESWLAQPDDDRLALVRQRTGRVESMWNDLSGDTGQPEPTLEAATHAGWTAIDPHQPFNVVPALGGATRLLGAERVLAAVREGLSRSPPWA